MDTLRITVRPRFHEVLTILNLGRSWDSLQFLVTWDNSAIKLRMTIVLRNVVATRTSCSNTTGSTEYRQLTEKVGGHILRNAFLLPLRFPFLRSVLPLLSPSLISTRLSDPLLSIPAPNDSTPLRLSCVLLLLLAPSGACISSWSTSLEVGEGTQLISTPPSALRLTPSSPSCTMALPLPFTFDDRS